MTTVAEGVTPMAEVIQQQELLDDQQEVCPASLECFSIFISFWFLNKSQFCSLIAGGVFGRHRRPPSGKNSTSRITSFLKILIQRLPKPFHIFALLFQSYEAVQPTIREAAVAAAPTSETTGVTEAEHVQPNEAAGAVAAAATPKPTSEATVVTEANTELWNSWEKPIQLTASGRGTVRYIIILLQALVLL
jgi:hypothetical protein